MALPRRIFIALGDPSDVSPVAARDVQLQELKAANLERDKAERRVKELEEIIIICQKQGRTESILGGVLLLVMVSAFSLAIWLCLHWRPSPPERAPEEKATPLVIPVPIPPAYYECKGRCGMDYDREYEDFQCWRHRRMNGHCFD
jgi:hypothetical protein